MNDFMTSIMIAGGGLHAQSARMRVIAENLANVDSTGRTPDEDPFRRRVPTFETVLNRELGAYEVRVGPMSLDMSDFAERYEPGHPAADGNGYVRYPNINSLVEMMDMREAQRTYEANLNVVTVSRQMLGSTLDILRG